ncbi:MAG: DUF7255 family protein [Bacteroidales bacterium]
MGERQNNIIKYLCEDYNFSKIKIPSKDDYKASKYYNEIFSIYKELGGILDEIPFGIKSKDLDYVINGKILELDEENHFNKYRAITLKASIYDKGKTLNKKKYLKYCECYQDNCRTDGGYWRKDPSDDQFGKSNNNGNLQGNGSSRWKQRAFYDMLKDFIPYINKTPIKRISIYDKIEVEGEMIEINKILKTYNLKYNKIITELIRNYVG